MNATTVQNVVTYDAIIDFDNPELKLFPGMTAYVTIPVATVQNVVKVPNAALRYKPPISPDEVRALYAKFGIDSSQSTGAERRPGAGDAAAASATARRRRRAARTNAHRVEAETRRHDRAGADRTRHHRPRVHRGDARASRARSKPGDEVVTGSLSTATSGPPSTAVRR